MQVALGYFINAVYMGILCFSNGFFILDKVNPIPNPHLPNLQGLLPCLTPSTHTTSLLSIYVLLYAFPKLILTSYHLASSLAQSM